MQTEIKGLAEKIAALIKSGNKEEALRIILSAAPRNSLIDMFQISCDMIIGIKNGELKPEEIPDTAVDVALCTIKAISDTKVAERRANEAARAAFEKMLGKKPGDQGSAGIGEMHVIHGTKEEVMEKLSELMDGMKPKN